MIPTYTSAARTASAHTRAGGVSSAVNNDMSATTSLARETASFAAATNDRDAGRRASSEVWLRNTSRAADMTHSIQTLTRKVDRSRRS
jgi:hypothetical protein